MTGLAMLMLTAGVVGVLAAPVYRRLCDWADWGLMTGHARRRVSVVRGRLQAMAVGSAGVASAGLVLGLVSALTTA